MPAQTVPPRRDTYPAAEPREILVSAGPDEQAGAVWHARFERAFKGARDSCTLQARRQEEETGRDVPSAETGDCGEEASVAPATAVTDAGVAVH